VSYNRSMQVFETCRGGATPPTPAIMRSYELSFCAVSCSEYGDFVFSLYTCIKDQEKAAVEMV
jgi:hypothetical protein